MHIYLARLTDGRWLQRIDTRRALPVAHGVDPVVWLSRVDAEFTACRQTFIQSVAAQFRVDPRDVELVEREMDGWVDDAPYAALRASLASGTFEGRTVVAAPATPPPDPLAAWKAKVAAATTVSELGALVIEARK